MLINHCIKHGGIFENAESVAVMVDSIHILDADHTPGDVGMVPVNNGKADALRAIRETNSTKNQS